MAARTAEATELRIPADPQYIVVAKRAAAGMASVAGLGLEALDELNIAIAEACEHTIRAAVAAGMIDAKVRINFQVQEDALRVEVRLLGTRPQPKVEAGPRGRAAALATAEALDLAISMLSCFADDVDFQAAGDGLVRVRLAKYRWR
ncbi:MAG TPA: ATP-binding protein [Candidatus Dormibacteraeota bacterium]|nr:ATP-binding protein [Candidatus Dormibacteraeota bacterium]